MTRPVRAIGCAAFSGWMVVAACAQPPFASDRGPVLGDPQQVASLADPKPFEAIAVPPIAVPDEQAEEQAEEQVVFTLDALESLAIANHPALAEGFARVQAERGQWLQDGLYPNPVVGYTAEEIGASGSAGLQGAFISQDFIRGGKLPLSQAIAKQQIRQAQYQLAAQRLRVLNDVRTAFYDVLVAQQTIDITAQLLEVGEQGWQVTEDLLETAEGNRIDVLQARVEADTVRIALQQAHNRHAASWRQLLSVVGLPDLQPQRLAGDLTGGLAEISWETALGRLMAESPELLAATAGVDQAEAALRRARAEPIPDVTVQTAVQYDSDSRGTVANLQLGLPLPVFNQNQGNIRRAEAGLTAARAAVARTQLNLQNRLAAAYERYANARAAVDTYRQQILPNANETLGLVNTGYRQGEFNYLAVLTAQRTYFQANLAYLNAQRELRAATIAIDGLLLSDGLQNGG